MNTPDLHCLKIKLLRPEAKAPTYAHPGEDAAFDIYSCEDFVLSPGGHHTFMVGVASEFPSEFWLKIEGKSGHAHRNSIAVVGGVIDAGYRNEWGIILVNLGHHAWTVTKGMAIAQGALHYRPSFMIEVVDTLEDSARGKHGLGSGHQTALPLK